MFKRKNPLGHHHPFYVCWMSMRKRCDENRRFYEKVTYDQRWKNFIPFYQDMFVTWKPGLSLDRIDNDGNYSKMNCRWATRIQQCNNTRRNRRITVNGITHTLIEWSRHTGIKSSTIRQRIDKYKWSSEQAILGKEQFA